MESSLTYIANYLLTQSWQIALLTIVIAFISFLLRTRSAHIRYILWLIVLAKCLVPPFYAVPLAVLPEQEQTQYRHSEAINQNMTYSYSLPEVVESETPLSISDAPREEKSRPEVGENRINYGTRAILAIIWLVGTAIFAFYYLFNALRTEIWLIKQRKELPEQYKIEIEKLFKSHGVKRMPHLWLLDKVNQPFVWGLVRGSIYLPAEMINAKHVKSHTSLIGHELSHIIRFDALINSLQVIAQAIYWFHPFVWWTNRKIRIEREKCCDEMTIARMNALPQDYSEAIVEILAAKYERTRRIPSLAVAGKVKNIEERIKIILTPGKKFYKRPGIIAASIVILIALITVPTAFVLTTRANTATVSNNTQDEVQTNSNINFQLDVPVSIPLPENNFNSPKILKNPVIKFYRENNNLYANLDFEYSSWPKTTWHVSLDFPDKIIKSIQAEFENTGTIERYPFVENQQVKVDCGKWEDLKNVSSFKFDLESVRSSQGGVIKYDEKTLLSLELDRLNSTRVIKLNHAQFAKNNDSQTIGLNLNVTYLSWPKTKWQITCALFDKDGNLFGKSGKIIENSGMILGVPLIFDEDVSMFILSNTQIKFSDVERYEITVEKIKNNTQNSDTAKETASDFQPQRIQLLRISGREGTLYEAPNEKVKGFIVNWKNWQGQPVQEPLLRIFADSIEEGVIKGLPKARTRILDGRYDVMYRDYLSGEKTAGKRTVVVTRASGGGIKSIVVDGQELPLYDDVYAPKLSANGKHYAYCAVSKTSKAQFAIIDGKKQDEYDFCSGVVFSPNGNRYAYIARNGSQTFAVIDGTQGKAYPCKERKIVTTEPVFSYDAYYGTEVIMWSPDSTKVAYVLPEVVGVECPARVLINERVVSEIPTKDMLQFLWSKDSKHFAFIGKSPDGGQCVVLDGKNLMLHEDIRDFEFSPDGSRFAYVAWDSGLNEPPCRVFCQDEASPRFYEPVVLGKISWEHNVTAVVFSPDSKHLAYVSKDSNEGGKWFVMLDGRKMQEYDDIVTIPVFEGNTIIYVAVEKGKDSTRVVKVSDSIR